MFIIEISASSAFSLPSPGEDSISSFAWHPKQRYRLLSVTPSGLVSDFYACDRLPMVRISFQDSWGLLSFHDSMNYSIFAFIDVIESLLESKLSQIKTETFLNPF